MRLVNSDALQGRHGRAIRLSCWLLPGAAKASTNGRLVPCSFILWQVGGARWRESGALMRRLADSRSGKESCVMPISREPRCRAEDACRSAYRRRPGDRRVDGDLPTRAAGREPVLGPAAVYRAAAATREALGERHRGVLDAACRRTPPRVPARAERHAISGSPRVCRWTETLSRRYNSPPPQHNWQAHENAVASVATVLAMTPTEAAATATPVRVRLVIEGSCEMTRMGASPRTAEGPNSGTASRNRTIDRQLRKIAK